MTEIHNQSYSYDGIGNRKAATQGATTTNYTSNALNQYRVNNSGPARNHDEDGNKTLSEDYNIYQWDAENRLIYFVEFSNQGKSFSFEYDYLGRRYSKTSFNNNPSRTYTIYDGWNPIAEDGGYNLYGFVENNGVDKWDYLGMKTKMSAVCATLQDQSSIRIGSVKGEVEVGRVGAVTKKWAKKLNLNPLLRTDRNNWAVDEVELEWEVCECECGSGILNAGKIECNWEKEEREEGPIFTSVKGSQIMPVGWLNKSGAEKAGRDKLEEMKSNEGL